jgi:hypothetical protein
MPVDQSERDRRQALLHEHYAAENNHDLEAIMDTFAADGVMVFNGQTFPSDEAIRWTHGYIGMTAAPGAFTELLVYIDQEHYTDEDIVVEGRLTGKHSSDFLGFPATDREVELPFVAFYRFDGQDKLISERVVMNLGQLHG